MKPKYWNKGKIYLSNKDKVLKKLIKTYKKEHLNLNNNYFHSLINSVIGQQISVSAAHSIKNKFFSIKKNITPLNVLKIKTNDKKSPIDVKTLFFKLIDIIYMAPKFLFLL